MPKLNTGVWRQGNEYKYFLPEQINKTFSWHDRRIDLLLSEANRWLGELNAYSTIVPNVDFFIQMHVIKEATESSKIEGTKADVTDAVLPEQEVAIEKRDDWMEVQRYIEAMNFSIEELKRIPLSMRLMKEAHKILLANVRGEQKQPGEIRKSQNWIRGTSPKDAVFVPPSHEHVPELLDDLQKFWHNKELALPALIKIALGHYQFETIHPFLDGNGRIGRLLITLQLVEAGLLQRPTLYLSEFFEKRRALYEDGLMLVREKGDFDRWLLFVLEGVITTAKNGVETFRKIMALRARYDETILALGSRAQYGNKLLQHLFGSPITDVKRAADACEISFNTANTLLLLLVDKGVLKEMTGSSRNRLFSLHKYLELFK